MQNLFFAWILIKIFYFYINGERKNEGCCKWKDHFERQDN